MSVRDQDGSPGPAGVPAASWSAALALVAEAAEAVLGHEVGDLEATDNLLDDVGLDSFGLLVLTSELEIRLGADLPVSDEEPTVGAAARAVMAATRLAG